MKNNLILIVASFVFGSCAAAKVAPPRGAPVAGTTSSHERRQALIEDQMASEAALTGAERAAVAAVRADLTRNEAQQRAAVRDIRGGYRSLTETMMAEHAAAKTALNAELL